LTPDATGINSIWRECFMNRSLFFTLLAVLVQSAIPTQAADLTRIERTIAKEPAYKSKSQKYCLLVFGPEAKTKVWLVLDGGTLYIDRNGNGDLTEKGKRVEGKGFGGYFFEAGDVKDGALTHTNIRVVKASVSLLAADQINNLPEYQRRALKENAGATGYLVAAEVAVPGRHGAATDGRVDQQALFDAAGLLQFASEPRNAPIIHFGGPWSMGLQGKQVIQLGEPDDIVVGFGTPGLGAGTFAFTCYEELVPEDAFPVMDVVFPAKQAGQGVVKEHYVLRHRC
jgi:hypothetical protein